LKRSVFLFWLCSNLAILCVPIVITMVVLFRSQHLLHSEVIRSNEALLNQVKMSLDAEIKDMKRMGLQLSLEPKVINYLGLKDYQSTQAKLDTLQMISTLRTYTASNGDIADLYVYLKKPGFGVTTSTMVEADLLYQYFHTGKNVTMNTWLEFMERTYAGTIQMLTDNDIVYIQSLPFQETDQAPATLVVLLNPDRLKSAISEIQLAKSGSVMIVDKDNKPVMSVGEPITGRELDFGRLSEERGSFLQGHITVSYVASEENEWKYVSVIPTKVYTAKVSQLKNWIYVSLLMCLSIGGFMSVWLTRRNYLPIRRMVDMVSPKVKTNLHEVRNEFSLLQSFLSDNAADMDTAQRTIEQQHRTLSKHFLARLLKGRVESGSVLAQTLDSFELRFETNHFAVLLFHIGGFEGLFQDDQSRDAESKLQFVHYIVGNIAEELLGQNHRVFSTEVDGMLAFLVNIRGTDEQGVKADLFEAAQAAQQLIQTKFYVQLTIGMSEIHAATNSIPRCFEEALEALEYKFVLGPSQIIPFDRIKRPKNELYYPLDTERQLINHIKTNVSDGTLSMQLGKLLMFELIGTILKGIEHLQQGEDELAVEKSELIKELMGCESFAEMENEIYRFLKMVCDYIDSKKKSHNTHLKDQVLIYIEEHLSDMNLSLTSVSLHFSVNGPYLSRFFKEQTGETFIDYVNQQRVNLGKKLLAEKDWTINDITLKAGFTNSNTFIRVFKRYEGITPGQFRKGE
jgi:AraC-like DNA-binding protein